jgi:spoIIIJ-associated protein
VLRSGSSDPFVTRKGYAVAETDVAGSAEATDEGVEPAGAVGGSRVIVDAEPDDGSGTPAGAVDADSDGGDSDEPDDEDESDESDEDDEEEEEDDDEEEDAADVAGSPRRGRRGSVSLKRLEEEGEVAADYLEELLDITDLDGDIDIDVENGRASVAIVAESSSERELRRLVGARGEVLEALQELSRLAVQARTGERSRLMLDVAGFRAARRRTLEDVGARACQEVKRGGEPVRLDPMSAFERKVVHDVVAAAGLRSESEGEEPGRRVVVFPASS